MSSLHPLADAVNDPAPHGDAVSPWTMAGGLFLAPTAFTVQVVGSYVLAALGCGASVNPFVWLVALNVVCVAATGWGLVLAYRAWKRARSEKEGDVHDLAETGEGRTRFLALFAICSTTVFAMAVLLDLTAIVMLNRCLGYPTIN